MNNKNKYAAKVVRKLDAKGRIIDQYNSIKEAAVANGLSYGYLAACMRSGKNCHGIRLEYYTKTFIMPLSNKASDFQISHNPYNVYKGRERV